MEKGPRGYYVKDWNKVRNHPLGFIVRRTHLGLTENHLTVNRMTARSASLPKLIAAIEKFTGRTYEVSRVKNQFYYKIIRHLDD